MIMGIFESLGLMNGHRIQNGRENTQIQQEKRIPTVQELSMDPVRILRNEGYTIPDGITDPKQLSMYLINSNQVRNGRLQTLRNVLNTFK